MVTTEGVLGRGYRQLAADDAGVERSSFLAQTLDVQRERFTGVVGGFQQRLYHRNAENDNAA